MPIGYEAIDLKMKYSLRFCSDTLFDWILRRQRCPFCVAPFPVLKCVGFELWQCPKCETDFSLDEEGHLEPSFNENHYRYQVNHFPKPDYSTGTQLNILCQTCTENQQKIVQLLQSFESSDSSSGEHRKQYELYASKLENRYPLCATCTYRVSVHLKRCQEDASLMKRRNTALNGGDWLNKLKLARKMKWKQTTRRFMKVFFFWPDFLFQLFLTLKCILKSQDTFYFYSIATFSFNESDLTVWLPNRFNFSSLFHVFIFTLFLIQFNGIAFSLSFKSNSSSIFFKIIPQLFLLISRIFIGNFLFRFDKSLIDLNATLTLAAVGLAIIFKTGSKNVPIYLGSKNSNVVGESEILFSKNTNEPIFKESTKRTRADRGDKNGFAAYCENHYKYHSFANMVDSDQAKPIMPWPEKPLPGLLDSSSALNFDENLLNNLNNSKSAANQYKMRPTRLGNYEDPLELEPMFSSFSLSDEPRSSRRRVLQDKQIRNSDSNSTSNVNSSQSSKIVLQPVLSNVKTIERFNLNPSFIGNIVLSLVLAICRVYLIKQTSLISVILALTFGLRGFLWPRLPLKMQLASLSVAIGRLIWLGAVLNGKIEQRFGYLALTIDLILILLR